MFAHLRQHGSKRVSKSVPAHPGDSKSSECRLNLFSLTLKLDLTACSRAIFRKEKRNLPACCRGFAISTLARSVLCLDASATALQTLPFLCSSGSRLAASNTSVE